MSYLNHRCVLLPLLLSSLCPAASTSSSLHLSLSLPPSHPSPPPSFFPLRSAQVIVYYDSMQWRLHVCRQTNIPLIYT